MFGVISARLGASAPRFANSRLLTNHEVAKEPLTDPRFRIGDMKFKIDDLQLSIGDPKSKIDDLQLRIADPKLKKGDLQLRIGGPQFKVDDLHLSIDDPKLRIDDLESRIVDSTSKSQSAYAPKDISCGRKLLIYKRLQQERTANHT